MIPIHFFSNSRLCPGISFSARPNTRTFAIMMRFVFIVTCIIGLVSCEKDIDFDLKQEPNVLVVEGDIETGLPPRIVLTRSFGYFNQLSPALLANVFVRGANVTISNGTRIHTLKEYRDSLAPGISFYYYSIDSANLSTAFVGEEQTSYSLTIVAEGKTYQSSTTIPRLAVYPDSVFFKPVPQNSDTTLRSINVRISEPPGLGNYIRYYTKRNSEPMYSGFNSVFSDEVVDGTTFTFQLEPGVDRNDPPPFGENFFKTGDTLVLKYANIDRDTYRFWNTWEFSQQSIGNPFAQPNTVIGNISNGALGAFCGYATWYRSFIVQ